MNQRWQSVAVRVPLFYAGGAVLWIGVTDLAVSWVAHASLATAGLNFGKGVLFVAVTSLLLYLILRRLLGTEAEARAAAEATVRRLQELEAIAKHSGELLYKHGLDQRFTYVSPQHESLLGYGAEELGMEWTKYVTDNPINQTAFMLTQRALETGERQPPYLVEIRKKDGRPILLEVDESPLKDDAGKVIGMVGAARDVTEREKAQDALRESEKRFRQLAETISDVFWIANLDLSQVHYVSPAYEQIWGHTCESLYRDARSWAAAIHPEDRERAWAALGSERGKGEVTVEYRIVRPDGAVRWILDRAYPLRDEAGQQAGVVGLARDVTERKVAETAEREREENLRRLYASMNEGLALHEIVCDASGAAVDYRILDVNPAFEAITGLGRDQVVGVLASKAYGSGQAPYLETYAPVAASGRPATFETHFAPLDKHFTVSVFSPCPGQFATVFADISKRKEAERQICLLNQVYDLISHINEAIVRLSDRETLFRETCRIVAEHGQFQMAWIGLSGATREIRPVAWAGQEDGYLAGPEAATAAKPCGDGLAGIAVREGRVVVVSNIAEEPRMAPWRDAALARGYRSVVALPLKQGQRFIGALSVYASQPGFFSAIVTESLVEVTASLSFALDLFERNRERERERQQLRLQHSALEAAANAIVITDREGAIQWVNDAFTRLTGYEREEAIGRNPRLLKSGVQDVNFYHHLWQTVLGGAVWQGGVTNKRKDGTLYEEEMTITPVRAQMAEITHFIAIKQDVTERKRLEQQFLRAQRMQSIGLLAGGVAHDLNNVLAPVLMALPLLRSPLAPEQRNHIIDTLEQSVKRGANIVQQVLTFARGVAVQRVLVQLRHLLREVTRIAEETFPRDIHIRTDVPASLWPFLGDPTQIHQVLLNLAVNARDAMPAGGQLSFTARNVELRDTRQFLDFELPPGRYASVAIADTGTGIPPEIVERIFEPFFTTKPAGKGTGLGLSTVLGIIKSHGGLVEVQSQIGVGSTFAVYLPAAPVEAAPDRTDPAALLPQGHGELILLVDDEPGILHVSRSTLEANGYHVVTARDGREAVATLSHQGPAVKAVVTDLMMPYMDGLALTASLRKQYPALPVIATTGLLNPPNEEDRASQLQALGVKHLLRKPFQAEELLSVLQTALTRKATAEPS
jgi:PAS domain S-box-containing protein